MTLSFLKPLLLGPFVAMTAAPFGAGADEPVFHKLAEGLNLPFSEAVAYNGVLYLSGQIGTRAGDGLVAGGIQAEARQTMDNIKAVVEKHDLTMADIIKCTVFLADIAEWPTFNEVYVSYFDADRMPARSAFAASGLALGARVEVECIAALK